MGGAGPGGSQPDEQVVARQPTRRLDSVGKLQQHNCRIYRQPVATIFAGKLPPVYAIVNRTDWVGIGLSDPSCGYAKYV